MGKGPPVIGPPDRGPPNIAPGIGAGPGRGPPCQAPNIGFGPGFGLGFGPLGEGPPLKGLGPLLAGMLTTTWQPITAAQNYGIRKIIICS